MDSINIGKKEGTGPDQVFSGDAGTGQANEELEWGRRHIPPEPYLAIRKTEIIGTGVKPKHKQRRGKRKGLVGEEQE